MKFKIDKVLKLDEYRAIIYFTDRPPISLFSGDGAILEVINYFIYA